MRKVSFIDPNDAQLTFGLLNADNTRYRILTSAAAQAKVAKAGGPLYSVEDDIEQGALGRALSAMLAANPV